MDKRAGPLGEISLDRGEISRGGMKILPYKHLQAGWPLAGTIIFRTAHAFCSGRVCKMADKIIEASTEVKRMNINAKKPQRKNFRWETDMIEHLIDCLLDYKSLMTFKNLDFDADKPAQYKHLRVAMANIYEEDVSLILVWSARSNPFAR